MVEALRPGDPSLPQKDQGYEPQFIFTRGTAAMLDVLRFSPEQYNPFLKTLDGQLVLAARTEHLLAIGLIAVPGTEGSAGQIVGEDGYVVHAVSLWALPEESCSYHNKRTTNPIVEEHCLSWESFSNMDGKILIMTNFDESVDKYPTPEAIMETLKDERERVKNFTLTVNREVGHCEFWGMVTTEQLRRELPKNSI